jgi:hypothetical protein
MPGIAAATGTVLDSAAKHTMACRVDEDKMHVFATAEHIINNKHKYCVNRHELVLNTGKGWKSRSAGTATAYPLVVSNLGDMHEHVRLVIKYAYALLLTPRDLAVAEGFLGKVKSTDRDISRQLGQIPFMHAQGYSLGVAYANHRQGDIVCAVQVGGMVTVRNGHFACATGDMVQWYFDWEKDQFQEHDTSQNAAAGSRIQLDDRLRTAITEFNGDSADAKKAIEDALNTLPARAAFTANRQAAARQSFAGRDLGMDNGKINVPYPKPYVVSRDNGEHYGDQIRVFAKCVNGGRAHDMIDIMLMTQSL